MPEIQPTEQSEIKDQAEPGLVTCETCFNTHLATEKCQYCSPDDEPKTNDVAVSSEPAPPIEKPKPVRVKRAAKKTNSQPPVTETCPKCGYVQTRWKGGAFRCVKCHYLSPVEKTEKFLCSACGTTTTRRYGTTTNPICKKCKSRNGVLTRDTTETKFLGN